MKQPTNEWNWVSWSKWFYERGIIPAISFKEINAQFKTRREVQDVMELNMFLYGKW
jgi:hypothetical protein